MRKQAFLLLLGMLIAGDISAMAEETFLAAASQEPVRGFTYTHQEIAQPSIVISHEDMTNRAIKERVMALRRDRRQQMPYLDRGTIRDTIYPEKVKGKLEFLSAGEKNLPALVDRAMETHLPAQAARERVGLAQRRIFVAVRELFPEASFEYEDREGVLSGDSKFNSRGYHFTVRQPIFRGGILWNTMLQERAELKAAQKEYDKIVEDLVKDISEAYFEYNRSSQVVQDRRDAVERMKRYVSISEQKFREELISEIEHLNVQSLASQMEYDYETAKQELELAKLDLQNFLNLKNEDDIAVSTLYDIENLLEKSRVQSESPSILESYSEDFGVHEKLPDLSELVDMAYRHRSELQIEAAKLTSARLRERVRWGELLPHADVVLEMGALGEALDFNAVDPKRTNEFRLLLEFKWNAWGNTLGYEFENDENAPTVTQFQGQGGSQTTRNTFSVGLLDGLDALVEIKEAEAEKLDQIVELENAEKEVVQDVKQAYFEYQKALIQMKSTIKRLDYRERLSLLSKHRLEQNEIQISEYVQSEIDLLQERMELHKALKDYFTAKAALNRAVGVRNYLPIEESYGN